MLNLSSTVYNVDPSQESREESEVTTYPRCLESGGLELITCGADEVVA
jgi:hypothetical protein